MSAMESMDMKGISEPCVRGGAARAYSIKITYFAAPEVAFEERAAELAAASNAVCLERLVGVIGDGAVVFGGSPMPCWLVISARCASSSPHSRFSRDGFCVAHAPYLRCTAVNGRPRIKLRRTQARSTAAKRTSSATGDDSRGADVGTLCARWLPTLRAEGFEITEPE